jgi:ABC-2 type transport system permease protein
MFWTVFAVERRNLLRDRAVWAVLIGFSVLVTYAAIGGATYARAERVEIALAKTEQDARLAALRQEVVDLQNGAAVRHATDPREPSIVGRELGRRALSLPPSPLGAVSVGQRDLLPHTIWVTTEARLADTGADDAGSLSRKVTGVFDLAFVLVFLLPVVVIALSFDLLAAERERGTLALVLSQPVSLSAFVGGKAALRGAVLLVVVLFAALVVPFAFGGGFVGDAAAVSVLLYVALLVIYTAFWFCLSLCVNAFGTSSAGNALSLVSVWLVLVVVVPGLASIAVDTLYPSPSRVELVNRAREVAREVEAEASALSGDHGAPAEAAGATAGRAARVQTELENRVLPVMDAFAAQLARQQRLVDRLRFLSPSIVTYEGLNDVAGSGVTRHQHFSAAVERYHAEYKRFFFERLEQNRKLTLADYDQMPSFEYREAPVTELARRVGLGLLGLLVPALALLLVARAGFRRHITRGY